MEFSKANFAQLPGVSDDILADHAHWGELLVKWNRRINLVAPSTVSDYWHRHAYDGWQVIADIDAKAERILDLGSGAGFPGLSAAIEMKARGRGHVWLVESVGKKVNFMRTVIRELSLPATVLDARAEDLELEPFEVITARAFAPLPRLLTYAHPFWGAETQGLFLKGQGLAKEITQAQSEWAFTHQAKQSLTDETGYVLEVSSLKPLLLEGGINETGSG